ncbi:hypothetical protein ACERIT_06795 [Halopenitus sp. H-Gu1]|uniref:hypothetical protein n=1 Tax=Halopenitus sp. H-Gu1 TaxID=3242697 RepID=UPI00359ECB78
MAQLEFVPMDIETTGLEVTDEVTVVGFALPLGCRVFVQAPGQPEADELQATVQDRVETHVNLSRHDSETALLRAVGEFVAKRLHGDDVLLVAYNGERWKDGFDLPFLRTRLASTNVEWPFRDLPYADLLPVVTRRFNLVVNGESQASLSAAYGTLVGGGLNAVDPFSDSETAVTAFENGELDDLVVHNVADILRTAELGALTERYCSKSDYQLKSLTPTIHDT